MAMKELLYRLQPMQIYIVLALSIVYFLMQLFLSHITHALTLLVSVYHMLCNIVALSGCIMTIKHCKDYDSPDGRNGNSSGSGSSSSNSISNSSVSLNDNQASAKANLQSAISLTPSGTAVVQSNGKQMVEADFGGKKHRRRERSLRNTFGWMRIEILTMLIAGIFLGAFCFSLIIEALQTLIHISHKDTMHYPVAIFTLAIGGLILNAFCYLLIGGYTHHQANFRRITPAGDVVLDQMANRNGLVRGSRRLSNDTKHSDCNQINTLTQSNGSSIQIDTTQSPMATAGAATKDRASTQNIPTPCLTLRQKHSLIEFARDISSTIFVMICSVIIYIVQFYFKSEAVTKFVDPILSIVSGITLLVLSYPYMKESGLILLQTIPASIDIETFKSDLLRQFDDIVSVHDLHIWQMTSSKYVSTAHIVFHNPMVYANIKDAVVNFFYNQGITIVTIQPEFKVKTGGDGIDAPADPDKPVNGTSIVQCLMGCQSLECAPKTCCSTNDLQLILTHDGENGKVEKLKAKTSKAAAKDSADGGKSRSLLSLNVASLMKLRRFTGSAQDIMKKSASESHVTRIGDENAAGNGNARHESSTSSSTVNNSQFIHDSIDELKEIEFHKQCGDRSEKRMPTQEHLSRSHASESTKQCEDSGLLTKPSMDDCNDTQEHPDDIEPHSSHTNAK